jgi:hypothetical protein
MAIFMHLARSYRELMTGANRRQLDEITLGWWAQITDKAADEYGDYIFGVHDNTIVSVYRVDETNRWERDSSDGRICFHAAESAEFAHLIGTPSPVTWGAGQARPIRYYDTAVLRGGDVEIEPSPEGSRAVLGVFTVSCDNNETTLTVLAPTGTTVNVRSLA